MFRFLKKIVTTNLNEKFAALLLAFVVWLINSQGTLEDKYIVVQVPVIYSSVPDEVVITSGLLTSVNITLKTNQNISNDAQQDFKMIVDVSKLKLGDNKHRFSINDFLGPKDIVWSIDPEEALLKLEQKLTKKLMVKLNFSSKISAELKKQIEFSPSEITLTGPVSKLLNKKTINTLDIDLAKLKEEKQLEVELILPKFSSANEGSVISVQLNQE